MPRAFDPGYGSEPWRTLVSEAPGKQAYPAADFRLEWGPVFHRGRLDGSAKLLIIGQDPAQHETILRRILVGEAGHRIQGFLAKLGIDRSYVLVNTFLYSVFGQGRGEKHRNSKRIATYRNRWIKEILDGGDVEAVIALGSLANSAWDSFKASPDGSGVNVKFEPITHPTRPEAAGGGGAAHAAATKRMLENWNAALERLHPLQDPDRTRPLRLYGDRFEPGDKVSIPEIDVPPWAPDWMRLNDGWADRKGTGAAKRRNITVTVPREFIP